jgi:peptidoglycan/LPS O-acetylase OafA/YrhL
MSKINSLEYRPDIDGLRAIAVLSVIIFHAFPRFNPGGFIGVDIFFVISGFLISTIIFRSLDNNSFSILDFYKRRIKRIFPALILVLISSLILGWMLLLETEFQGLGKHVLSSIGFVLNGVLWREGTQYFGSPIEYKPLINLWSLGVEEQFYLVWPLIAYFIWKFREFFLVIIGLLLLTSFLINIFGLYIFHKNSFCYYLPFSRFWELSAGGALGYITIYKNNYLNSVITKVFSMRNKNEAINNIKSFTGLFLIIISSIFINADKSFFPGFLALLPVFGAFLIIDSGSNAWVNRVVLSNRFLVKIGLISYPLYLWHWPLLSFNMFIYAGNPTISSIIFVILISFLFSFLTYSFIEKPIRYRKNTNIVLFLISVSTLTGIFGFFIWFDKIKPYSSQFEIKNITTAINDWEYPTKNLQPFQVSGQTFYNTKDYKEKILLYGDSNIQQYAPRFEKLLSDNKIEKSLVFYAQQGCIPIQNLKSLSSPSCNEFAKNFIKIANNPDIKTVVIGARWGAYLEGKHRVYYEEMDFKEYLDESQIALDKTLNQFEVMLKKLVELGKNVYVILNIPTGDILDPRFMIERSLINEKFKINIKPFHKENFSNLNLNFINGLKNISSKVGAITIDPLDSLCNVDSNCASVYEGKPIYCDSAHISSSFVRENVKYLDFLITDKLFQMNSSKIIN